MRVSVSSTALLHAMLIIRIDEIPVFANHSIAILFTTLWINVLFVVFFDEAHLCCDSIKVLFEHIKVEVHYTKLVTGD